MKITREQIIAINDMIEKAIDHGGDSGGPYFSSIDDLLASLNEFINVFEIENIKIIIKENGYPYLEMIEGE